jgi:hypothetical protein
MRHLALGLAVFAILPIAGVHGQAKDREKAPAADRQREFAADAMKRSDVKDARVVQTPRLVVATTLPEAKAKALADHLDKVYLTATKALKLDPADEKARLIVLTFPELDQYRQFKRSVIKERPDDTETSSHDVRRDDPYVAVAPSRGVKNPNFETLAAAEVCRAVLAKKGGNARLPEWMKDGFARAVQMRADPRSVGTDRSSVTRLAPRIPKGGKAAPVADKAWTGTGKEKDLVAASLMDFLTFGPGSEKLGSLLSAMIPSGGIEAPTFADALTGAEWMLEDLDRAWREWIYKGSPAAK